MKSLGLYIHIPFCEKKCDYCNFVSFCCQEDVKLKYVQALKKEIIKQAKEYNQYFLDTIFLGGGTPTCLPDGCIQDIMSCIYDNFIVDKNAEITIECNPNSISESKLQEFKNSKINRLSIGLQVYNNRLLRIIGRLHSKKQFDQSICLAKKYGFENINVDIILGIPRQKIRHVKKELKHLIKLDLKHISAYGLIVEPNTKLEKNLEQKIYNLPSETTQVKMYDYTKKYLQKHGLFRYEVSNFAKSGYESKHNLKYWTNKEYLGLGLTSSSYINETRWKNTDNFQEYISQIYNNILPQHDIEQINAKDSVTECIMLSLRTQSGIYLKEFKKRFGFDLLTAKKAVVYNLFDDGLVAIKDNRLFCTDLGFKLLNHVILCLID